VTIAKETKEAATKGRARKVTIAAKFKMPSRKVAMIKTLENENKNKSIIAIEPIAFIHDTSDPSNCIFPNSILFEQTELADCFLEYPRFDDQGRAPFRFETIQQYQANDDTLQRDLQ
jgi:hypothetical protein